MKKTLLTFSVATMMLGGLVGCGADQQGQNAGTGTQGLGMHQTTGVNQTGQGGLFGNRMGADTGVGTTAVGRTATHHARGTEAQGMNRVRTNNFRAAEATPPTGGDTQAPATGRETNRQERLGGREHQGKFTDVAEGAWYAEDIEWSADVGLFEGVGGGKFAPGESLTRAQAATLFARLHDDGILTFPDVEEDEDETEDGTEGDTTGDAGDATDEAGTGTDGDATDEVGTGTDGDATGDAGTGAGTDGGL